MSQDIKIRIDKWLWACRFYKTRALAKAAVEGGKVNYQGQKPKPGKFIQLGEIVKLRQGSDEKTVIIRALEDKRPSAPIAQTFYEETEESIYKRQELSQMRKMSAPISHGKPDKKQRRLIHRFKNVHDYSPNNETS